MGILVRKKANIEFQEIDVEGGKMAEDIMAGILEYKSGRMSKRILIIIVYMTVEGREARLDNPVKYRIIKDIIGKNRGMATIVMGDMNAHIGVLGERVNGNGELLLQFSEDEAMEILSSTIAEGKVT